MPRLRVRRDALKIRDWKPGLFAYADTSGPRLKPRADGPESVQGATATCAGTALPNTAQGGAFTSFVIAETGKQNSKLARGNDSHFDPIVAAGRGCFLRTTVA